MYTMMKAIERFSQQSTTSSDSIATNINTVIPKFQPFDSSSELWTDYWKCFQTFFGAKSVQDSKKAQTFLTHQSNAIYKFLANMASQLTPTKDINELSLDGIVEIMQKQNDPKRFVVRERFKFWSSLNRKPGDTFQELTARIRQEAATCNVSAIDDPQDEAMRTRFICSVGNEAGLKMLFKEDDDKLTFTKAVESACETEDAAQGAKETIYGSKQQSLNPVHVVRKKRNEPATPRNSERKPA